MSRKHCSHLADAPSPHTQISTTFASHGQLSRKVTNNDTASVTATAIQAASTEHIRTHQNTSSAESHGSDRGVVICPSWLGILGVLAHLGSQISQGGQLALCEGHPCWTIWSSAAALQTLAPWRSLELLKLFHLA